jgi:acetate kinase
MGTRCGDTGLGAIIYCMEKESLDFKELNNVVNKKSGLLGISGISPDMRDLQNAAKEGNERAALAIDVFVYKIRKYLGAYAFAMGGIDVIVFTGGIGENATMIREKVCSDLEFFGLKINKEVNDATHGQAALISTEDSKLKCIVMPTNEELVIARDTKTIIGLTK